MRAIVLALILAVATVGQASTLTGNNFHTYCQEQDALVLMYVGGWLDRRQFDIFVADSTENPQMKAKGFASFMKARMCIPEQATLVQLKDVVCKYLADNPAQRHMEATYIVELALAEGFPCK